MRFLILLAIAAALHAEDIKPLATAEELTKQVAEQQQQIDSLTALVGWYRVQFTQMLERQVIDAQLKQKAPAKAEAKEGK